MIIKDYQQISTKQGDKGTSKNYSNETYTKDDILFETLGTMDELSSTLGLTYHYTHYEFIKTIQHMLQTINTLIATNKALNEERYEKLTKVTEQDIEALEQEEAHHLEKNPLEPRFVLPGSEATKPNAYFDLSRAITRRAERTLVRFINTYEREDLDKPRQYLNRLSDLLFILARNYQKGDA